MCAEMRNNIKKKLLRTALALVLVVAVGAALAARARRAEHMATAASIPVPAAPAATDERSLTATDERSSAATAAPTPAPSAPPTPAPAPATGRRVDPEKKMIALTFDDGPGAGTQRILSALDAVDGRATFCMVGNRVGQYAQTARRVAEQGSEIATHTWDHPNLAKLSAAQVQRELERSMDAIERVTGVRPTVLRPPYGSVNATVRAACRELGLVIANWNIDPEDWRVRDARQVYRHIMDNARDGAIVVCHDLYPETAAAMESAVQELTERGYQLVTVSELLEARAGGGEAGRLYYAA